MRQKLLIVLLLVSATATVPSVSAYNSGLQATSQRVQEKNTDNKETLHERVNEVKKLPANLQFNAFQQSLYKNKKRSAAKSSLQAQQLAILNGAPVEDHTTILRSFLMKKRVHQGLNKIKSSSVLISEMRSESEPNGTSGAANSISYEQVLQGTIANAADEDWFSFNGRRGEILDAFVYAQELGSGLDAVLALYDSDAQTVLSLNDDYQESDPRVLYRLPHDGIYFFRLITYSTNLIGNYELQFNLLGSDTENGLNDNLTQGQRLTGLSGAVFAEINNVGDRDVFTLNIPAYKSIGIRLEGVEDETSPDLVLSLYNAQGELLAANDDHLGGILFISDLAFKNQGAAADFHIVASGFSDGDIGRYVFSYREIKPAGSNIIYAALGEQGSGKLLSLNAANGGSTFQGFTRFHNISALAINTQNEIFGIKPGDEHSACLRIDEGSGMGYGLSQLTDLKNVQAMAFDHRDTLFVVDDDNKLYRINPYAGTKQLLKNLTQLSGKIGDMTYDLKSGRAFLSTATNGQIWKMDLPNGTPDLIGTTGRTAGTSALAFYKGGLIGTTGGVAAPNTLLTISQSTGAASALGSTGYNAVNGLAAQLDIVKDVRIKEIVGLQAERTFSPYEKVTVIIENASNVVQGGFRVSYKVSGSAQASATEIAAGLKLQPGQAGGYTFQKRADLSQAGTYTVEAEVEILNDVNVADNKKSVQAVSKGIRTDVDSGQSVPHTFALHQNHPNPFNPATKIAYSLAHSSSVQLTIYDTRGRAVRHFDFNQKAAGPHQLVWDATDDAGKRVASGFYLYTLKAGSFTAKRKLLLLK